MMKTLFLAALLAWPAFANAEPLRVCATVPDLGDLVRQVGGDEVTVTVFAKGPEDPHFVEAKPSFTKALSKADAYIQVGLELEAGWAPVLLGQARNKKVLPGHDGFIDASTAIEPMHVPQGTIDRAMGDVHAGGNPHYLLDPLNGAKVAELIASRLGQLRPEKAAYFKDRCHAYCRRMEEALAGWQALVQPCAGAKVVSDHDMWPYFAHRFGLDVIGFLEPKPGLPPTTRHLGALVEIMKTDQVRLILASSYYDPRHADFVSAKTGAVVVNLAHQVGARPGTDDYIAMLDYNVQRIVAAANTEHP
jgi:zinc/manganese transport system substrate-binding protein